MAHFVVNFIHGKTMSESEKTTRFEVRPPTEKYMSRSGGSTTDVSESDVMDHNPIQRSPRRRPIMKSFSSRANKTTIKPENKEDVRHMQSDFPATGSLMISLNPEALKQSADAGNPAAQLCYGNALLEGKDVPMDLQNALKYLKLSADNKNAEACCKYSLTLMANRKTPQDLEEAIQYLERAAILGDPQGQYEYGRLLVVGKQIPKNAEKGYNFIKAAADQDYSPAQLKFSHTLMHGNQYIKKNIKEGIRYLKLASKNKNPDAMNRLAQLYERGDVVNQNFEKAVALFKEAAELGNSEAENAYGTILLKGEYGITPKPEKALKILEKAASKDNAIALFNLGVYMSTSDSKEEQMKGVQSLKKSASLGYDRAQYNMGLILEKGELLPKDLKEAAKYYEQASLKGNSKAQCNFAAMLAAGEGVEKDEERAMELFKQAADKGNTISQYRYAQMLEKTQAMALYRSQITEYYLMAANSGHSRAQFCAAKYIETNDRTSAKTLYAAAAESGIDEALYRLAILMKLDNEEYIPTMREAAKRGIVDAEVEVAMYTIKNGNDQEKKAALETFRKAAETGHCIAKYNYGAALLHTNRAEGLKYLKQAADEGNAQAQLKYGLELKEDGNVSAAYKYILMAANSGNVDAQYTCAMMLENGEGVNKSQQQAYEFIEQAAKGGNPEAQFRYSEMLERGINTLKSHADSIRYLKYSADNGYPKAIIIYSKVLLEQNSTQAVKYAKRAATMENPSPDAIVTYAKLLRNGFGIQRDIPKSIEEFKRAAKLGSRDANFFLGNMILDGEYEESDEVAESYLIKAADKGHKQAMKTLAEYFEANNEKDKAKHFYRLAANEGENESRRKYAEILLDDKSEKKRRAGDIILRQAAEEYEVESEYIVSCLPDVEKTKEGKRMLQNSAMSGYPPALYKLSRGSASSTKLLEAASSAGYADALYALGVILSQTQPIRAPAYLTAAAEKGKTIAYIKLAELANNEIDAKNNLKAAYNANVPGAEAKLGKLYESTDYEKAVKLYKKGSQKGDPEAMFRYAMVLRNKDPDSQEGRSLLIRASTQNVPEAKMELAKELRSKGELSDALKLYNTVARQTGDKKAIEAAQEITKIIGTENICNDLQNLIKSKAKE